MTDQQTNGDFTPTGLKIEAPFENHRNSNNAELFKAMIREAYGAGDVIVAHHLTYVVEDKRGEYTYEIVEEIPSADTLIFDHQAAVKIWGDGYRDILAGLAMLPTEARDAHLKAMYYSRIK